MSILRLRGKFKGFFFLLKLQKITPRNLFVFAGHLAELSKWIARNRKIPFSDFYASEFKYDKRYDLYTYLVDKENITANIDYLEFGVSKGYSFRWWAEHIKDSGSRFFGFDTFSGLPEDWGPFKKGAMSNGNVPPEMNDARCKFYQGLFQQTLFDFIKTYVPGSRRVIHMDADLYSSTLFVLTSFSQFIKKGDILIFDEFNVPLHEFKAFKEWTESFYIDYEVLGAVNNFYQVAIKIK